MNYEKKGESAWNELDGPHDAVDELDVRIDEGNPLFARICNEVLAKVAFVDSERLLYFQQSKESNHKWLCQNFDMYRAKIKFNS